MKIFLAILEVIFGLYLCLVIGYYELTVDEIEELQIEIQELRHGHFQGYFTDKIDLQILSKDQQVYYLSSEKTPNAKDLRDGDQLEVIAHSFRSKTWTDLLYFKGQYDKFLVDWKIKNRTLKEYPPTIKNQVQDSIFIILILTLLILGLLSKFEESICRPIIHQKGAIEFNKPTWFELIEIFLISISTFSLSVIGYFLIKSTNLIAGYATIIICLYFGILMLYNCFSEIKYRIILNDENLIFYGKVIDSYKLNEIKSIEYECIIIDGNQKTYTITVNNVRHSLTDMNLSAYYDDLKWHLEKKMKQFLL